MSELASADELRRRRDARPAEHKDFYVVVPEELDAIIAALKDRERLRAAMEQIAEITAEMGPSRMKAGEIARAALEGRDG